MNKYIVLAVLSVLMFTIGCAHQDNASEPQENVVIAHQDQAVLGGWCQSHPAACEVWCDNHPFLCGLLCDVRPNLPVCAPECGLGDDPCVNDSDCCEGYYCADNGNGTFICDNIPIDAGVCEGPGPNDVCPPEMDGLPCCPDPSGGQWFCGASDPSDPNTEYVCNPAP